MSEYNSNSSDRGSYNDNRRGYRGDRSGSDRGYYARRYENGNDGRESRESRETREFREDGNVGNNHDGGDNRDSHEGGYSRGYRNNRNGGGYNRGNRNYRREPEPSYNIEERAKQAEKLDETINSPEAAKALTADDIARREEYSLPISEFDQLSSLIDLKIIRGVMAYGFETPSPIQQKAIKPLLGGYDIIAQAQSGMGKTATFCIGTLGNIDFTKNEIQAIVLAHTMELAQQIEIVFTNIGKYSDLRIGKAVKSVPVRDNIDQLTGRNNQNLVPHVIIGTPGRVLDMLNKNVINAKTIKMLVMDEADELLSEGFIHQIKNIISMLNGNIQIGLFSATMEPSFFRITQNFMRNPLNILIKKETLTLEGIKQFYIDCEKNEYKFETLCDLYSLISVSHAIIYCNHYQGVEQLTRKLQEQNFKVSCIHGNMDITQREEAMRKFRSSETRVLISTDLLGRGIDVQQVSIVINYDIPLKIESYIHRIGRSGRYGRKGTAINLSVGNDMKRINELERYYQTRIEPLPQDVERVLASD